MTTVIGANTATFQIPAGILTAGTHTLIVRETGTGIVSPAATITVGNPPVIAPALGTTGLLFDLDPNLPANVTQSGGLITQITGANGTSGTAIAHGSPILATVGALNAIKFATSTSDYFDLTAALLASIKTQLGSGALTIIAVTQFLDTAGLIPLDISQKAGTAFVNHITAYQSGPSYNARQVYGDATNGGDQSVYGTGALPTATNELTIGQVQQSIHPIVALNANAAVGTGNGTAGNITLTNLDTVTVGARFVSGAVGSPGNAYLLRLLVYAGGSLTAAAVSANQTTIRNWANTNYGTP